MRKKLISAIIALCALVGLTSVQPAGAAGINQAWRLGYPTITSPTNYLGCSVGAAVNVTTSGNALPIGTYMIYPKHCVTPGVSGQPANLYFNSPSNNFFNTASTADVFYPLYNLDVVAVRMGNPGLVDQHFRTVANYCASGAFGWGNCSSWFNTGYTTNTQARTTFRTRVGYGSSSSIYSGIYLCKSGWKAGVGCGYSYQVSGTGSGVFQEWYIDNVTGCGVAGGDSGGPVFQVDGNGNPYLFGMMFEGGNPFSAGANNGCYAPGTTVGTQAYFYPIHSIVGAFGLTWGTNVTGA